MSSWRVVRSDVPATISVWVGCEPAGWELSDA